MKRVITISREYGAGGHSIGRKVAEELGVPFYDRDIVKETVKKSGFDKDLVLEEEEDESRAEGIWKFLSSFSGGAGNFHDTQETIHEIQSAVIAKLAHEGPCVILGRCADVILKSEGIDCLNVFIYGDDVHRAARVGELIGTTDADEIQKAMNRKDENRHYFYSHMTGRKWGDSRNYHLCVDSGLLGYDTCVKLICEAARAIDEKK